MRQQNRRDAGVVVDDLTLGEAVLRVQHLVEVGQFQLPSLNIDHSLGSHLTDSAVFTCCMRAIWKGTVSFGLVSIGVRVFSATEEKDVSFHQVRRSDGSRIRYKRVAEADGEEVTYGEIAKGYQLPDGETVVLTDEDFADLPLPTAKVVDVLRFVPADELDPIYTARATTLSRRSPPRSPTCCCAMRWRRAAWSAS